MSCIHTPKCIELILSKYTKYHPVSFLLKEVYSVPLSSLYLEINKCKMSSIIVLETQIMGSGSLYQMPLNVPQIFNGKC